MSRAVRERLPYRRVGETVTVEFEGMAFALTIGRYVDGRPGEIFLRSIKPGSAIDRLADDIGVLVSLLLQHGLTPAAIAHSLGRLDGGKAPSSVIGAALALLVDHESK